MRDTVTGELFEPRIVAFFCTWCTYTAADLAGTARMRYAPNVRIVRLMCSGRVDPSSSWPRSARAPTAC
jgi:Methyl-viologen-reducing hydrogenase, delta subunit